MFVTIYRLNEHRFPLVTRQGYFSNPVYIRGSFCEGKAARWQSWTTKLPSEAEITFSTQHYFHFQPTHLWHDYACRDNFISLNTKPKISALLPSNVAKCRTTGNCQHIYYNNTPKASQHVSDFRFAQQCCWRLKSCGKWRHVTCWCFCAS